MNMEDKYHFFEKHPDFIWHLDNDEQEISLMKWHRDHHNKYVETNTGTIGVIFEYHYQDECNKLLDLPNETKD
jgi:sterol desaturase/sphingolipid hydroxylase (fatty acid hydroxylase superfamily)